jgi:hypothetical protein
MFVLVTGTLWVTTASDFVMCLAARSRALLASDDRVVLRERATFARQQ